MPHCEWRPRAEAGLPCIAAICGQRQQLSQVLWGGGLSSWTATLSYCAREVTGQQASAGRQEQESEEGRLRGRETLWVEQKGRQGWKEKRLS